ncbi:MAG TPA: hypothetical protein VHB30_06905 [Solirubrobacteraceae bacterium]|jgi:hypothetical protein|nr:hypothetical protein [Solirubrobacteraceae bacterium]
MLFDLRARGRRRTVKVVYALLAVLLGGGLIFFGVGGNVGGGLLDAVNNNKGGGSGGDLLAKDEQRLEQRIRRNPDNAHLWAELAQIRVQDATTGANYDQSTSTYTSSGLARLRQASNAWDHYLAASPAKPDDAIASVMVQALGALGRYARATKAAEIVAAAQPSPGTYEQLAQYAWAAGQESKGDLAADKAVSLAPKAQRKTVRSQLDSFKSQLSQQAAGTSTTG